MNKSTKPPCPSWGKGRGKGLQYISAMALLLFGSAVVTFSLVVDPSGAIDYSVNTFFAEAAATALVIFGLKPPNTPAAAVEVEAPLNVNVRKLTRKYCKYEN